MCATRLYQDTFGIELPYLPELTSITFDGTDSGSGVPWQVLERCLRLPRIRSVSWGLGACFVVVDPYPAQVIENMPICLTSFHYERPRRMWRTLVVEPNKYGFTGPPPEKEIRIESLSINPVVLRMHQTAESLRLMVESTDIARMAEVEWPNLREFVLSGKLPSSLAAPLLIELLQHMPRLTNLSVNIALPARSGRLSVLGRAPQPWVERLELRSLSLAYPDPADTIFCANMAGLKHLSLSDYPRYYYHLAFTLVSDSYDAPILTSSECLRILKRMNLPVLESLTLSYVADEADEDLLRYIPDTFPQLRTVELHRYRKNRHDVVQYVRLRPLRPSMILMA